LGLGLNDMKLEIGNMYLTDLGLGLNDMKLEIGNMYLSENDDVVEIIGFHAVDDLYEGDDGHFYEEDGIGFTSPYDLIGEID